MRPKLLSILIMSLLLGGQPGNGRDRSVGSDTCQTTVRLPIPTGPHRVGTTTRYWADTTQPEPMTADTTDFRQFAASLFYPGWVEEDNVPRPYFPDLSAFRAAEQASRRASARGMDTLAQRFACVRTSTYTDVPLDPSGGPYPVLFISPGGDMSRHWYTAMAQELTSHGYVVVVMSHAHSGMDMFPWGGLIRKHPYYREDDPVRNAELTQRMAEDVRFIFERIAALGSSGATSAFAGRLALDQVAIIGHSRGARAANLVCKTDNRFKACVRLDGLGPPIPPVLGLTQPQMTLRRPWNKPHRTAALRRLLTSGTHVAYDVVIRNVSHFSFSDLTLVLPEAFRADIEPERGHALIGQYLRAFITQALGSPDTPWPDPSLPYPDNVSVTAY